MRALKVIAFALLMMVLAFLSAGLFFPRSYEVRRSVVIEANRSRIHPYLANLERWSEWAPWEDERGLHKSMGPRTAGVGASQEWESRSGSGWLEITQSSTLTGVAYDLSFDDGKFDCTASMLYDDHGPGTRVTWTMTGDDGGTYFGRYFVAMADKMIGPMFVRGLDNLKRVVEDASN